MRGWLLVVCACGRIDFGQTQHVEYVATVAECLNPSAPDPAKCRSVNGAKQLVVDLMDTTTSNPWYGYVRFDPAVPGELVSATLRMVATSDAKADAPASGEVWEVAPFALADLSTSVPAKVRMLANDPGPIVPDQVVEWPLATTTVPSYFGIYPTNTDGTNYWNLDGTDPPRLLVDYR